MLEKMYRYCRKKMLMCFDSSSIRILRDVGCFIIVIFYLFFAACSCNQPSEPFIGAPEKTVNVSKTSAEPKRGLLLYALA